MMVEFTDLISAFWGIFSFSFLVALTGAVSPGPLLTYTIVKSAERKRHGYLTGLWVILGHAVLETGIVLFLLSGFSFVLENAMVVCAIGLAGGVILVYFGISIARSVYRGDLSTGFPESPDREDRGAGDFRNKGLENPVVGGIMVSMSNPYWWVWWATIGFAFMVQFNVSFGKWPKLLAFFLGHEAGDLMWYLLVSFLAFFGLRHMDKKIYHGVLLSCGVFMVLFGIYLGVSPILRLIDTR